jgi:glycosyltransferase involved in cell wall biosynthesis
MIMRTEPLFSVIIPTYNREAFIEKAARSVLTQTYPNFELLVVDDGSTDNTEKIVSSFRDTRLFYFKQNNRGASGARNTGIKKARGAFICFLDSDDLWVPEKLSISSEYIDRFPEIKIFHTEEIWFRRGEHLNQKRKHTKPSGRVYGNALKLCCIGMSTAIVKKEVFSSIGMFDETFEACEDYDLWLRASNVFEVKLIPEALTIKHGGRPDQLSVKTWGLDRFRIKALEKMLRSGNLKSEDYYLTLTELRKKCKLFASGCEKRSKLSEAQYYRALSSSFPG